MIATSARYGCNSVVVSCIACESGEVTDAVGLHLCFMHYCAVQIVEQNGPNVGPGARAGAGDGGHLLLPDTHDGFERPRPPRQAPVQISWWADTHKAQMALQTMNATICTIRRNKVT
jgi:hypothetical protein